MQYDRLQLPANSNDQFIDAVIGTLCLTEGVQTATRVPGSLDVSVQFDEQVTSTDVMRATLKLAGYTLDEKKKSTGCCGACGG